MLDDLVEVIETLKERIAVHGTNLRENEIRTCNALIDPLLQALGWNTADPAMVLPQYNVSGRKADYALLGSNSRPSATLEAKKLGESLDAHRMQMLNYANASGVEYAGLTDGDKWELYEVFKRGQLEERRLLDVSIASTPAHECALKLLLLWRPNLASGQPVVASEPLTELPPESTQPPAGLAAAASAPILANMAPLVQSSVSSDTWKPLTSIQYNNGDPPPSHIRFRYGDAQQIKYWVSVWVQICEWLAVSGHLTSDSYAIPGSKRQLVNKTGQHPNGREFEVKRVTSTGLYMECNYNPQGTIRNSLFLLQETGVDPSTVELRFQ